MITYARFQSNIAIVAGVLLLSGAGAAYADITPLDKGFSHLTSTMDLDTDRFYVYAGADRGYNHFYPSWWLNGGSNISYDGDCRQDCPPGSSCIRIAWTGQSGDDGQPWNGIVFQDMPNEKDGVSGLGFDLRGATHLKGYIRTNDPGLRLKLMVGVPWDSCGQVAVWSKPLSRSWEPFEIDLRGKDLSCVSGGFGVVFNELYTPHPSQGCIFYLKDIAFDVPNSGRLRLLRSFEPRSDRTAEENMPNTCFLYDNALAMIAFLARNHAEDIRRAQLMADALIYCQAHDRAFHDGRLRNGYMSGDIPVHPGDPARLPGIWNVKDVKVYEDKDQVNTHTGNTAWAMIALLGVYERTRDVRYLACAAALGNWVETQCRDTSPDSKYGGYTGGYDGWDANQTKATYKSTEMNLDLIPAFARLYMDTGDARWLERHARYARNFVNRMFDAGEGRFLTGTSLAGDGQETLNRLQKPLDVNPWALLVLGPNDQTRAGMHWSESHCLVDGPQGDGFIGFAFHDSGEDNTGAPDGVWWEGTGQMIVAFQTLGETDRANRYLAEMRRAQASAPNGNGLGLVAASHDGVSTGFDWKYFRQVHLGATSWFLLAELGCNPYWGTSTSRPVPDLDHIQPIAPHPMPIPVARFRICVPREPVEWDSHMLTSPIFLDGAVALAPVREVADLLGVVLAVDGTRITASYNGAAAVLHQGTRSMTIRGKKVVLPAAPQRLDTVLYAPLSWLRTAFHANVADKGDGNYTIVLGAKHARLAAPSSSTPLIQAAWAGVNNNDEQEALLAARTCIALFGDEGQRQQALKARQEGGLVDWKPGDSDEEQHRAFKYWALNDVAACWFVIGKESYDHGEKSAARSAFRQIKADYSLAEIWDPQGWFWSPVKSIRNEFSDAGPVGLASLSPSGGDSLIGPLCNVVMMAQYGRRVRIDGI